MYSFSMLINAQKYSLAVRHCLFGVVVFSFMSLSNQALSAEETKTIPLKLPNQQNSIGLEDDIAIYPLDTPSSSKETVPNWFIAGGIHYSLSEAKAKQDSRQKRCQYYRQLQNVLPLSPEGTYTYRDFVEKEIQFFCG